MFFQVCLVTRRSGVPVQLAGVQIIDFCDLSRCVRLQRCAGVMDYVLCFSRCVG